MMTPMRTIIELPEEQIRELSEITRRERISRAEAIRRAIAAYLHSQASRSEAAEKAFGSWKGRRRGDGLRYEDRLRDEW